MGHKPEVGGLTVGRYVSEAWFGRKLARHPPANRRVPNVPARPLAGPAPLPRRGQPEPRPERTRPAGKALIVTGTVLLVAVSSPLPFLNVKLLGLIMIMAGLIKARALQRVFTWLRQNRVRNVPTRPLAGPAPLPRRGQPERRPERTRPAGMALIVTGTVLLLVVSSPLPFLNVKLLGLIMIIAGLVKARALQRVLTSLWQSRLEAMAARVPLDTLLEANAPVARPAGRRAARARRRPRPGARGGQRPGQLERRRRRRAGADQLADGRFTVTVIVPAYNEEDGIRDTLDALVQQTDRPASPSARSSKISTGRLRSR